MAQPSTGPVGCGQVAVPPNSGDEGDDGSRISCATVLATADESIDRGPMPPACSADRDVPRLPDLAPILASCA
jgi:hypothetical protein